MPKSNKAACEAAVTARRAKREQRKTQPSQILYRPDNDTLLLLRQTSEKVTALFAKVHNLQVQVESLRDENRKLARLYVELLHDPRHVRDAESVRMDAINRSQGR